MLRAGYGNKSSLTRGSMCCHALSCTSDVSKAVSGWWPGRNGQRAVAKSRPRETQAGTTLSLVFSLTIKTGAFSWVILARLSVPAARLNVPWDEKILSWLRMRF